MQKWILKIPHFIYTIAKTMIRNCSVDLYFCENLSWKKKSPIVLSGSHGKNKDNKIVFFLDFRGANNAMRKINSWFLVLYAKIYDQKRWIWLELLFFSIFQLVYTRSCCTEDDGLFLKERINFYRTRYARESNWASQWIWFKPLQ